MIIDAKQAFNIIADGSNETAKINQALTAATGENTGELIYFPPGIYGCDGLDPIDNVASFFGAGPRRTEFKNLSPDQRLFEFKGGNPSGNPFGTAFSRVGGFSVDQNGSVGDGFQLNVMYSRLHNIWLRGQAGEGWAVNAKNCTLSRLMDDVHISTSSNGLFLDTCYYPRIVGCSVERTTGPAVKAVACADISFTDLYLDHGYTASTEAPAIELMQIFDTSTVRFSGLSMELAGGNNLVPNRYMHFKNSSNINVSSVRINHSAAESSSYMFYVEDGSLSIDKAEWFEYQSGMVFVGAKGTQTLLSLRDVVTYVNTTGSKHAIGCWDGPIHRLVVNGWHDRNNQTEAWPNAAVKDMKNYNFVVKP